MDLPAQISGSDGWTGPWAASSGAQFPFQAVPQTCAAVRCPAAKPRNHRDDQQARWRLWFCDGVTREATYALRGWERDVPELPEEKDACHRWDQIHDEVVVHHAPRVQLQTFQVVRGEKGRQLWATEYCESQRQVGSGLSEEEEEEENVFRLVDRLTVFLLLGLLILQDVQCQAWVETAELVREERQEAPAEIWRKQFGQNVQRWRDNSSARVEEEELCSFTSPEGRQPLALQLGNLVCIQLLQHHTGVLPGQVVLNTTTHQTLQSIHQQHQEGPVCSYTHRGLSEVHWSITCFLPEPVRLKKKNI